MSHKLSVRDLSLSAKRILVRVDFNVPLDKNANITDDSRILAALPTINYIIEQGGIPILMSHLGRPKGEIKQEYSLAPVAKALEQLLGKPVLMLKDSVGLGVEEAVNRLKRGDVALLENLRFHKGEEKPEQEPDFVCNLAKLGDLYVNDAFGTAHRAHASTVAITKFFPEKSAAGFLLEKEINFLSKVVQSPKRPFVALIGGAKISSKLGVLEALLDKVDALLIGGGMAYTFFKAQGIDVGHSICEEELVEKAKEIMKKAEEKGVKLLLPTDTVIAVAPRHEVEKQTVVSQNGFPKGTEGLDIGKETIARFSVELNKAKTVLWNGPMGFFEVPPFNSGTLAIAKLLANAEATTIVGGGDSVAAIVQSGLADRFTHLSTGGGASLEYVEFGTLPGIDALSEKKQSQSVCNQ